MTSFTISFKIQEAPSHSSRRHMLSIGVQFYIFHTLFTMTQVEDNCHEMVTKEFWYSSWTHKNQEGSNTKLLCSKKLHTSLSCGCGLHHYEVQATTSSGYCNIILGCTHIKKHIINGSTDFDVPPDTQRKSHNHKLQHSEWLILVFFHCSFECLNVST